MDRSPVLFLRVTAAVLASLLSVITGSPAHAATPPNDDLEAARVVSSSPYTDSLNTTHATAGDNDPCGLATVWYEFTPRITGPYQIDTYGSDYDTSISVRDRGGTMSAAACYDDTRQAGIRVDMRAGTTYLIMAGTCCGWGFEPGEIGPGGNLVLNISPSVPVQVRISVDQVVLSTAPGGRHIIAGTITCSEPAMAYIHVDWSRERGRGVARGAGYGDMACSTSPARWESRPEDFPRGFSGPRVEAVATVMACADYVCGHDRSSATLKPTRMP